jgi:hypothetical protein
MPSESASPDVTTVSAVDAGVAVSVVLSGVAAEAAPTLARDGPPPQAERESTSEAVTNGNKARMFNDTGRCRVSDVIGRTRL